MHLIALGIRGLLFLVALLDGVYLGLDALHLETAAHRLDAQR